MRIPLLAALAVVCALLPVAGAAQEKTPQNALAFIQAQLQNGAWKGDYDQCFSSGRCDFYRDAQVQSVFAQDDYCQINVTMRGHTNLITRTINLRQAFTISNSGPDVYFLGPVRRGDGSIVPDWTIHGPSYEIATRVAAAFNYLSSRCKGDTGPW